MDDFCALIEAAQAGNKEAYEHLTSQFQRKIVRKEGSLIIHAAAFIHVVKQE